MKMKFEMLPVITIEELEKNLIEKYGDLFNDYLQRYNLRSIMFRTTYMNDVCCFYSWEDKEDKEDEDEDEEIKIENCIKTLLEETFPDNPLVLIDVTW